MCDAVYPPPGVPSPGPMVDAAATSRGLLAMAFAPRGGAGLVQIVATSPLVSLTPPTVTPTVTLTLTVTGTLEP